MELLTIDEITYKKFALKNEYISIYQLPEWGTLKESTGWIRHLLGLYDKKTLKGVTMILEKKTVLGYSLFYAPRGYLLDVNNFNLLKVFHNKLIEYIKTYKGFMLKVDPNVIYNLRDSNGNLKKEVGSNIYFNFKKLGYKHLGFTQNFETLQPRYLCRIKLSDTYNDTLNSFTKSTKKNIIKTKDMGVRVRKIDEREIELFTSLLEETGLAKNFVVRPSSYYKKMYELMKDYLTLYIAYIDSNEYYNYVWNNLNTKKKELENLHQEMHKVNVGDKLRNKETILNNSIKKLDKELVYAKDLQKNKERINIGALMSVFIGNEGITFMSGTNKAYKGFNPKYAFYNEHIKDSLDKHLLYVNFYGISGDMDESSPYYGIYEMKKGFNPEIIELIGEFDYVINPIIYYAYKVALKGYKILKKIRKS